MSKIEALEGITYGEASQLRRKGITTIDGLWACVGEDLDKGIGRVVEETDIRPDRLKALLAAQSILEGKEGQGSWPRRHWPEISFAMVVAALVALALYTLVLKPQPPLAKQVVVKADTGLLANRVIGLDEVKLKKVPQQAGSFQKPENVVGRYPLEAIPAGATLHSDQLSDARLSPTDVEDRRLLSVPVKTQALSPTVRPTERVSLLLSPRSSGDETPLAVIEDDVIVWGIDRNSDVASITVAVTQDELEVIKSLLGISEVFIVQPSLKDTGGTQNDPPAVVGNGADDVLGTEGDLLETSWAFSDPDADDSPTLTANNTSGTFTDHGDGTWSWKLHTEDDVAEDSIKVIATDSRGETATDSFDYKVDNVAPTATLNYSFATIDEGPDEFTLSMSDPSDPGTRDTFEYRFDCGSGTYGDWSPSSSAHCSTDGSPATLDVRAQIRDDDGGISKEYTASVPVNTTCSCPIPDGDVNPDPNGHQKPPVLTSAEISSSGRTAVKGHLVSIAKRTCVVRFFSNRGSTNDPKIFIGKKSIIAGVDGNGSFTFSTRAASAGKSITATVTNARDNTSPFAASRIVAASSRFPGGNP